jgi:hypothetical protein
LLFPIRWLQSDYRNGDFRTPEQSLIRSSADECFRPEAGAGRPRANADALPGIASTRYDTHLAAGSDELQVRVPPLG